MREIQDTFLHYIADNLDPSIPARALRDDTSDASAGVLQLNAVNLSFLNFTLNKPSTPSTLQAVIDILNDNESACVDWVNAVWLLLRGIMIPLLDYSVPSTPAPVGRNLFWDKFTFRKVSGNSYAHYSCTVLLHFSAV